MMGEAFATPRASAFESVFMVALSGGLRRLQRVPTWRAGLCDTQRTTISSFESSLLLRSLPH